ncbi:MAG: GNAT family N-acetyltransferase [Pseudomonadota bacterium]
MSDPATAYTLRPPLRSELSALSELCLKSKAYWGYDADFMVACVDELTLTEDDLQTDPMIVAEDETGVAGIAQLSLASDGCYLEKLFIDPSRMGEGFGRRLYDWALQTAAAKGASSMIIEADPGAASFYERLGAKRVGEASSGSVAGRTLPRFIHPL